MNETGKQDNPVEGEATKPVGGEGLVHELLGLIRKDRLVKLGLVVLVLTTVLVVFVNMSTLPFDKPFVGLALFSLLPVFFVVGAIVFVLAILRH